MSNPTPIDYATPIVRPPPSAALAGVGFVFSAIAGGVGVLILLAFMLTEWTWLVSAGVIWLLVGGLMVFVAFVLGMSYAGMAIARKFPPPSSRWRAAMAILVPLAIVPIAVGCVIGGIAWGQRVSATLIIINASTTKLDAVDVIDSLGTRSLGPLQPGESRRVRSRSNDRSLSVTLSRSDDGNTYDVDNYFYAIPGNGPRRLTIDEAGIVRLRDGGKFSTPTVLSPATRPATQPAGVDSEMTQF